MFWYSLTMLATHTPAQLRTSLVQTPPETCWPAAHELTPGNPPHLHVHSAADRSEPQVGNHADGWSSVTFMLKNYARFMPGWGDNGAMDEALE